MENMIMSNQIKKYRAMKHITNQISGILLLIAMLVLMISSESDPSLNDGTLYIMDLGDGSTYTTTCPEEISGDQWIIKNKTCTLTTSVINLPGDPEVDPGIDIPINFSALRTGNLEVDDNVVLEYSIGADVIENLVDLLARLAEWVEIPPEKVEALLSDPDDDVVVACAVIGKANFLVTYDPHFDSLGGEYRGVKILKAIPFLEILRQSNK